MGARLAQDAGDRLTTILDHCPIGVVIAGADLTIRYGNRRFCAMMTGQTAHSDWPPLDHFVAAQADRQALRKALAGGAQTVGHEFNFVADQGRSVWVLITAEPIHFAGAAASLVWVDDVTTRRLATEALRASEERLDLAVAGTRSAIWEVDFSRRTTWWSKEFYRMLGYEDGGPRPPE
jgi:PAS domain S-box-containing protein